MLVRVSCDHCRLSPLWTDDPAALLQGSCRCPTDCRVRLVDEQFVEVKVDRVSGCHSSPRIPSFPRTEAAATAATPDGGSAFWVGLFPCIAALLASLALASAYESAAIIPILLGLAAPPLISFLLYGTSRKAIIAPLLSLTIAALGIDAFGVGALAVNPLERLLLMSVATVGPVVLDVEFLDLARLLPSNTAAWRWVPLTFVVVSALLLLVEFPSAHRIARREDEAIVRRLAPQIRVQGSSLVLDRLAPQLAREAKRRLLIVAGGRDYELSRASTETIPDQHTAATRVERHGIVRSNQVKRDRDERVTLMLPLQGDRVPDEVELEGVRGPEITYREKVALAK